MSDKNGHGLLDKLENVGEEIKEKAESVAAHIPKDKLENLKDKAEDGIEKAVDTIKDKLGK